MQIIGITHIKDEDIWIGKAIENLTAFCDQIIVVDNGSTDNTLSILQDYDVNVIHEPDLRNTHSYVEQYVGKDYWVQGFGGDEIYDPVGLKKVRDMILGGYYDNTFQVYPYFLHATEISEDGQFASGYLAPPSHPPGKLYNFKNLDAWPNARKNHMFLEPTRRIKPGVIAKDTHFHSIPWGTSPYRCLHTRFLSRSSNEPAWQVGGKLNPADLLGYIAGDFGDRPGYNERKKYRRGDLVTLDIAAFELGDQ